MVTTGARASALSKVLARAGMTPTGKPPAPRLSTLTADAAANVMDIYYRLGGTLLEPPLRPGTWDLSFDGILIELDEGFHFNRYRATTLDSGWARDLPWRSAYLDYCTQHERHSGTGGRRWSSPSATRMFGGTDPDGVFGDHGSSRWKQRALYDSVKDASAGAGDVRLSRVSIYDTIDGILLDHALYGRASLPPARVKEHVLSRLTRLTP
ncbi:hypothetical protein ACIQTT_09500 [Microbacterium sp. NPDC090225]|uniref:DUF7255 family protein n=1 Tax=Microbacterium sp. NPDC090225 TaxID=3364207 RepID=UPI0037F32555